MSEDLSHDDIQELLGAYSLDAVDERERAIIEAHLDETCESCRVELDDHRRLTEALRRHASRVSPLASTESNDSHKTSEDVARSGLVRRWEVRVVAMAILLVVVGALLAQMHLSSDHLATTTGRIELLLRAQQATADPAAVVTTLRTPSNDPVLTVVSRAAGGNSYAMYSALPPLADGRAYQLWRVDNGEATATVALGRRPDTVMVFLLPSGVTGFLLTVEKGPAPSRPTLPAVATGGVADRGKNAGWRSPKM